MAFTRKEPNDVLNPKASPRVTPGPSKLAAELIDGRALAEATQKALLPRIAAVLRLLKRPPGLGVVLVGSHGPSEVYVRNKARAAHKLGMASRVLRLPEQASQQELMAAIAQLNNDDAIDAFLVQLPLPAHLDGHAALLSIAPHKDGDALGPGAVRGPAGALQLIPCTPAGCLALIQEVCPTLNGLHAVVVGRSSIVGRPMAQLLLDHHATVTVCHSRTVDLACHTRSADVLVVAAGVPHLIRADHIKPGSVVIDVGIHRTQGPDGAVRLIGDVDTDGVRAVARAITPVPGGVGPMTIAMLLCNAVRAAEWSTHKTMEKNP